MHSTTFSELAATVTATVPTILAVGWKNIVLARLFTITFANSGKANPKAYPVITDPDISLKVIRPKRICGKVFTA